MSEYFLHMRGEGGNGGPYGPPNSSHVRQLLSLRDKRHHFCGVLHWAAAHGNNSVVQMLKPGPRDILEKDSQGNGVGHYVARHPNIEIFEYLARAMELSYSYTELQRSGLLADEYSREAREWRDFDGGESDDDSDDDGGLDEIKVLTAKASTVLKEGYLKKRRAGSRWAKKWVVLTESGLAYYGSKRSTVPKAFIPFEGTTVSRVSGELIFSVDNPSLYRSKSNSALTVIEFQAASEHELYEWFSPLSAMAEAGKDKGTSAWTKGAAVKGAVTTEVFEDGKRNEKPRDVVFAGYLKKRRVGGRWERRWVVLTDAGICYYKEKGDTQERGSIPIEGSTIERQSNDDPAFVITNDSLIQKKKHEGKSPSMEFMAENEMELQSWLLPLRAMSGMITSDSHFRPTLTSASGYGVKPVHYVNCELLQSWLSSRNQAGETVLHVLARFRNRSADGSIIMPTSRVLQISMWLIQNGCPLNGQNAEGQTALHVAVRFGNLELAQCLVGKGADVHIKNSQRQSVLDLATPDLQRTITRLCVEDAWNKHSHESFPPTRLKGYSYLSLHFQKHSQTSSKNRTDFEMLKNPYFCISVYNSLQKLVESTQNLPYPVVRRESFVWWACSWHMHTPLENIADGCYVIVELKNISSPDQLHQVQKRSNAMHQVKEMLSSKSAPEQEAFSPGETVSWFRIELDKSVLNSKMESFECQKPPIQHPKRGVATPNLSESDNSFLEAHMLLSKRGKKVDLGEYGRQPAWVHHHATPPGTGLRPTNHMHMNGSGHAKIDMAKLFGISRLK